MRSLCYRWASLTTLVAYVVVHVGLAALHHHHAEAPRAPASPCVDSAYLASATPDTDDDEHACPVCTVLHLTPDLPAVVQVVISLSPVHEAVSPLVVRRTHPIETPVLPRAPPHVEILF